MVGKYSRGTFPYELEKNVILYKKHARKHNKCLYTFNRYWDYVEKYRNFISDNSPLLIDNPIMNYRAYDKGLYRYDDNGTNLLKNIGKSFGDHKHTENFKLETRLAKRLYVYLKVFTPDWDDSYLSIRDYYFFKYRPLPYLNFLINSPWVHFIISNENLCYINKPPYCINYEKPYLIPIDRSTSVELFKCFQMPVPTTRIQKRLFDIIKEEFNFTYPDKKYINIYSETIPITNLDLYVETLNYRLFGVNLWLKYNDLAINYDPTNGKYITSRPKLLLQDYINFNFINHRLHNNLVPNNIATYLYKITGGDYNCLNNLACLVADITTSCCVHKKLNIILSSSENFSLIKNFIVEISDRKSAHTNYALKNIGQVNSIKELISNKANAIKALFINNYIERSDSNSYIKAKRIITGKKVSYNDSFAGEINYINSLALIRMTDSWEEITAYKNHLQSDKVNIISLSSKNTIPDFAPTTDDLDWLRVPFTLYGLNLIEGRHTSDRHEPLRKKHSVDTVAEFFDSFCDIDPTGKVIGSDLYDNYKSFCQKKYNNTPLTSTLFVKNIKKYLLDNHIKYEYGQFCHTVDSNPRCFKGFTLNLSKLNEYLQSEDECADESDYKLFYDHLLSMNSLIPDELLLSE